VKAPRLLLREHVKEAILQRILEGEYLPGERLVETRLAREFETSQVPVREALRDLEMLRFVESEPFRGARVREVSQEELLEIFPVRSALEEIAAREAARRPGTWHEALAEAYEEMVASAAAGDVHEQVRADVAFHTAIVDACGNSILGEVWRSLRIEGRTLVTALHTGIDLERVAAIHEPIRDALLGGDRRAAARSMAHHFQYLRNLLQEPRP
jgi:DNA-binding GntR family transcriptional regulator